MKSFAINAEKSLEMLIEGNKRFLEKSPSTPDHERRIESLDGQHPFAIVLCCSDSRVPPEIIFDKRIGDLFVVRVAGNILDDNVLGSIEFAVEHLGSSLIVVLGHQKCGAVISATKDIQVQSHIQSIFNAIKPAVEEAKNQSGDLIYNSVRNNIQITVNKLRLSDPVITKYLQNESLKIVGAYYCLDSGKVEFLDF